MGARCPQARHPRAHEPSTERPTGIDFPRVRRLSPSRLLPLVRIESKTPAVCFITINRAVPGIWL